MIKYIEVWKDTKAISSGVFEVEELPNITSNDDTVIAVCDTSVDVINAQGWVYNEETKTISEPISLQYKRHLEYLKATDWYVSRKSETGVEIPSNISLSRQEARDSITQEMKDDV